MIKEILPVLMGFLFGILISSAINSSNTVSVNYLNKNKSDNSTAQEVACRISLLQLDVK
jgi:hypothetical protein